MTALLCAMLLFLGFVVGYVAGVGVTNPSRSTRKRKLTDHICVTCRAASAKHDMHPGQNHRPGICDCPCREQ